MHRKIVPSIAFALLVVVASLPAGAANPTSRVVNGVAVYLGVIPAAIVRGHTSEHEESRMHGGAVAGDTHVMIALFDDKSGKRIADAEVAAAVTGPKRYREQKRLEPMLIASAPSYGNYFSLYGPGSYRVALSIRLPGAAQEIRTTFTWSLSGSEPAGHP